MLITQSQVDNIKMSESGNIYSSSEAESENDIIEIEDAQEDKLPFLYGINRIINAFFILTVVPGYIFLIFYGVFVRIPITKIEHFSLSYSMLLFVLYIAIMFGLAIYNDNYKVPKLKQIGASNLPTIGIQVIGRGQTYQQFSAVVNNLKHIDYPIQLIKRVVLAVDGNDNKNDDMIKVFKELFPLAHRISLEKHFSDYSPLEKKDILERCNDCKYLIVSQPHGGRRQIKYTAFSFASQNTEYVFHQDSDTMVSKSSLLNMAKLAAGYNIKNPNLKPCGGVVGEIKIMNVFNYFTFHMEISYWYAFNSSRSSQSALDCVTTVSGAMGLFHSNGMKKILLDYANQRFLCNKVKCVFGQDRHLTSSLIINGYSVLYDCNARAMTQSPKSVHGLIIQQSRWYKGCFRQNFVFFTNVFYFNCWSVLTLMISFSLPTLTLIHLFYSQIQGVNNIGFFIFFIFIVTAITSLRGVIRSGKLRLIHSLWHPIFYYFFLLPCKIVAILDIPFQDNRKFCQPRWIKVGHVYLWLVVGTAILVGYGFLYNILVDNEKLIRWLAIGLIIVLAFLVLLLIHWLTWGLGYFVPENMKKHEQIYEDARNEGFENFGVCETVIKSYEIVQVSPNFLTSTASASGSKTSI